MISNRKYENEIEKLQIDFHHKMKEVEDKHRKKLCEFDYKLTDLKNVFDSTVNKYIQEIKSLNARIGGYKKSNNEYQKSIKLLKEKITNISNEKIKLSESLIKLKNEKESFQNEVAELSLRLSEQIAIVENYNKCFKRKFIPSRKDEIINYDRKNT